MTLYTEKHVDSCSLDSDGPDFGMVVCHVVRPHELVYTAVDADYMCVNEEDMRTPRDAAFMAD